MRSILAAIRRSVGRVGEWIHDRAGLKPILEFARNHKVPPEVARTRKGWFYVFGQALIFVFIAQIVTGTALAMQYIPSPGHAWDSLQFLNNEVLWGGFVRGLHFFGASAMVLLAFVHMARVFITGSYKFPRELNWITGLILLFFVLAMAFTGQLLRWDHEGVATVQVAATLLGRFPLVGPYLMELVLAGDTLGGATLSRFFALHVIVFPLIMLGMIGVHVYLVVRNGVSEPPKAGRPVDPATYRQWYDRHKEAGGSAFWPDAAWREFVFVIVVYVAIFALAFLHGPMGPGAAPDPALVHVSPRPDWFFLWFYTLIWYKPPILDSIVLVWFPVLVFPLLMLLPILFNRGERAPSRRPWAIFVVASTFLMWATLTAFGIRSHWTPDFDTEPVPEAELAGAPPDAREGARVFHDRGCQYCHTALGRGGGYGPDLSGTPYRMSREEIVVRIIMGIRDMPAYQGRLEPGELEALLAYIHWAARQDRASPTDRSEAGPEGVR